MRLSLTFALALSLLTSCQCGTERPSVVFPQLEVSPASLDFGDVQVGQSATRTLTLRNPGRVALTISSLSTAGAASFTSSPEALAPLAIDGTATLTVTFAPSAPGAQTARLTITSDASNAPELLVSLAGAGVLDACAGVVCATPPSACHAAVGTCAAGQCTYAPRADGTACDDGDGCTTGDTCTAGACRGTALGCTTPPAPACTLDGGVVSFESPGTCSAGACTYPQRTVACTGGCDGGACGVDLCAGVTCTTPPPCFTGGRCVAGACQYDVAVGSSCNDADACTTSDVCLASGACAGAPVACTTPPAPTCVDAQTQRTADATGTCGGAAQCTYLTHDLTCPLGCDATTGLCRTTCPAQQHVCNNACVSDTSVATCGASCTPCPSPANGAATCVAGTCGVSCEAGYGVCGSACCRLPLAVQAYLKASNPGAGDFFGYRVALSADGDTLAIGALYEDGTLTDGGSDDSGAVYVFVRSGATWTQQALLRASNASWADNFGVAVSLSADGNLLAVGASGERSNATGVNGDQGNDLAPYAGAVYVFSRTGTTWTQQAYVKASNTGRDDAFGSNVALSGDGQTLAVGAPEEASLGTGVNGGGQGDNSAFLAGAAYVFARSGNTWVQQAYLKATNSGPSDFFGSGLALSHDGTTLAVSNVGDDSAASGINGNALDSSLQSAGAVFVYVRTGATWTQQAYVKASNPRFAAWFGSALSLASDGNTLAIGATGENSAATGVGGNQADTSAAAAGAVYVFTRAGTTWTQQAYVKASNTAAGDEFGVGVALSADGATLVCTAWGEDSAATTVNGDQTSNAAPESGAGYLFTRSGSTWTQQAFIKAPNAETTDRFGAAVALSADGGTVVLGAGAEDSAASGVNGDASNNDAGESGAAWVFTR